MLNLLNRSSPDIRKVSFKNEFPFEFIPEHKKYTEIVLVQVINLISKDDFLLVRAPSVPSH